MNTNRHIKECQTLAERLLLRGGLLSPYTQSLVAASLNTPSPATSSWTYIPNLCELLFVKVEEQTP
jgi:hypothetical protein